MNWSWSDFLISVLLYTLVSVYEVKYEDVREWFLWNTTRGQRVLFRSVVGAAAIALDVGLIFLFRFLPFSRFWRILLSCVALTMALLHVLNSVFAILRCGKGYVAVDIIGYLLRLFCVAAIGVLQYFVLSDSKVLITVAILYFIVSRSMRMLNGGWLDDRIEDF